MSKCLICGEKIEDIETLCKSCVDDNINDLNKERLRQEHKEGRVVIIDNKEGE